MAKKPGNSISFERIFTVVSFIVGVLFLAAILVPGFLAAGKQQKLTTCKVNLRTLAIAIGEYTTDHNNHYPDNLALLLPDYLDAIPKCPGAGRDTYSNDYRALLTERQLAENEDGQDVVIRAGYFLSCGGHYHEELSIPPGYPQYNDFDGLVEYPPNYPRPRRY